MKDMNQNTASVWNRIENWLYKAIALFFKKILKRNISKEQFAGIMEFVKFGLVGVTNTLVSYLIYVGTLLILRSFGLMPEVDYIAAQILSFVLSVLWSFLLNSKFVFILKEGEKRDWPSALAKAYISYSFTGLFLNSVLLILWVNVFHISEFLGPIINLFVSVPINFIMNKFWAFRSEGRKS
ncbi:MAG: GtrA family protein [Lachnospiraceae bacterium]